MGYPWSSQAGSQHSQRGEDGDGDTPFHPLEWRGGQKSHGFVSVTSFVVLLLEVCSWGCDSSRDILRRHVCLCRPGKAIDGELVLPRVDFKFFTSYKCIYSAL